MNDDAGTDRVELTDAEKWLIPHLTQLDAAADARDVYAAVGSIVAARVQALTAERDFERSRCASLAKTADALKAERDAARAEVASANARCAELRGEHDGGWFWSQAEWSDWSNRLASFLPEEYDGDEAQEAIIERALTDLVAERDALQATLDRVTAGTESVIDAIEETFLPQLPSKALSYFAQEDVNAGLDAMRERFGLEAGR